MRHDVGVLAAIGRVLRKFGGNEIDELTKPHVGVREQPQDLMTKPSRLDKGVVEAHSTTDNRCEPVQKLGVHVVDRDEGEEQRHMVRNSPARHRVELTPDVRNGLLGLGNLDDEGRAS